MADTFTPEEITLYEADAAEAERGYSIEFLRSCRRVGGRKPEIGSETAVVVPVRLDPERLRHLDEQAAQQHVTRSDVMRRALDRELASV